MKRTLLSLIAVLWFLPLHAEVRTMSLSNAVDSALRNNRQILQYEADLKASEAQAGQSFADLWYPRVDLGAGFQFVDEQTVTNSYLRSMKIVSNQTILTYDLPVMVSNEVTNAYQDNYAFTAGVSKTLFAGLRYWNAVSLKNVQTEIARLRLEDKRRETAASVTENFYSLLLARECVLLQETLLNGVQQRQNDTKAKYRQGLISDFDEIRSEVQLENIQPALDRLRNSYAAQKIALLVLIGLGDDEETEFTGRLEDSTNGISLPREEWATASALTNDPNLRAADKNVEVLRLGRGIAEGGRLPVLNGFFNYKFDYRKQNINDDGRAWGGGWNTGLQLSFPVEEWVPGSRTDNQIREADANIARMTAARNEIAEGLTAKVRTLLLQVDESRDLIRRLKGTSDKAARALELAKKLYKDGAASSIVLNDSEIAYTQVRTALLQEIWNYSARWTRLKRSMGI